ncbi:hypothetical protein BJ878DRAFT_179533 [Calycina marina]|uniref:Uncharacterized protein n=1 Tax=Calycina marina TaxID=1763456 RepID=A0A9P7YZ32_9HELO|nr:hypothetical protein BJ878DRAFT_179533 [Calycina marina]
MSPNSTSPYGDRPIRPLPKKPLRERLSPEVAQTIKYPPAYKSQPPLFQYGYTGDETVFRDNAVKSAEPPHPSERERADEIEKNYISRRNGEDVESDEEESAYRSRIYSRPNPDTPGRSYRYVQKLEPRHPKPQAPCSTASSIDGYDSFENTNNKKKRKIPTPGDTIVNGVHLSNDLAGMGISNSEDLNEDVGANVGSYTSGAGQGISGPGRGRYGRVRSGRSPLRTLSETSNNWGNVRTPKIRQPQWPTANETAGIISQSIATAEKYPITPSRGQENISILSEASRKTTPASTQFTFTCGSQVPSPNVWPAPNTTTNMPMQQSRATDNVTRNWDREQLAQYQINQMTAHHGTQTSPRPATQHDARQYPVNGQAPQQQHPQSRPKKSRPPKYAEFLLAAQQRREAQKWKNDHQPFSKEEQWMCEYCEYEQIFGEPPRALIRQYEIKDKAARKQEDERQRLLEKAKTKGRKGKKGPKTLPPKNVAPLPPPQPSPYHAPMDQRHSQGTQSEEYYEGEFDDEDGDENMPALVSDRAVRREEYKTPQYVMPPKDGAQAAAPLVPPT